jgi:hypothetical protein
MSRASKITLAATSLSAIGIVFFVHYAQQAEKTVRKKKKKHILPSFLPSQQSIYKLQNLADIFVV